MKSIKQSFLLFLGMSLMMMFTYFSYVVLRELKDILIATNDGLEMLLFLKRWILLPSTLIVGLFMIALSWNGNIKRTFLVFFPFNAFILGIFAFLLKTTSPFLNNQAIISGFYIWANISMVLSIALVWGFANQEYTFKTAAIQYPILIFLFTNFSLIFAGPFFIFCKSYTNPYTIILTTIAGLNLLTLAVYFWMNQCKLGTTEKGITSIWKYWAALAIIVFSIKFAVFFPEIIFKSQLKNLFPDIHSYAPFMKDFSTTRTIWAITASFVSLTLGLTLYFTNSKLLAKIAWVIALGMLMGGIFAFYGVHNSSLNQKTFTNTQMGYIYFVSFLAIFKFLKELMFFGIFKKNRFSAKIAIDVIAFSIAPSIASFLITLNIVFFGSVAKSSYVLAGLFIIAMIACIAGIYKIHQYFKKALPN